MSFMHIPNVAHISPIYYRFIIKIKPIFQSFEYRKKSENMEPPPPLSQNSLYFELWTF